MDELLLEFTDNERDLRDAFEIKRQVFVREQNVLDDLELDTYDKESFHMEVKVGERVIGTARVPLLPASQATFDRIQHGGET